VNFPRELNKVGVTTPRQRSADPTPGWGMLLFPPFRVARSFLFRSKARIVKGWDLRDLG